MTNYWVVRAGWDIQSEVEDRSLIGIGWGEVGDCSNLSREEVRQRVAESDPDGKPRSWAKTVSSLHCFASEISEGAIVLTPLKSTRKVLFGKVTGPYRYDAKPESECLANTRSVEWLRTNVSRDDLSLPLKNSLGALMAVFRVDGHEEEIRTLIEEEPTHQGWGLSEVDDDEIEQTDAEYAQEVEINARERILDLLYDKFDGYGFEEVVAAVLTAMGFTTRGHGPGPDRGVDIVATADALGFDEPRIKVQVKRSNTPIGRPEVQKLAGTLRQGEKGLFVSLGGFASQALDESGPSMSLFDGDAFIDLLLQHYDNLSPEIRTLIPLKRIYLPVG